MRSLDLLSVSSTTSAEYIDREVRARVERNVFKAEIEVDERVKERASRDDEKEAYCEDTVLRALYEVALARPRTVYRGANDVDRYGERED